MSNIYILIIVALLMGAVLPLQASVNTKLADHVGSPILSALISFIVGTIALLTYVLITGIPLANAANARNASPITWTGGLMGAFFVAAAIILLPKLGVAMTVTLIIAGQMLTGLIVDHFGILGVPVKEINAFRLFGAFLVIAGVVLIRKY
jgi:bacterial/archaeal transporter family-2 protein